ncbi:hypothetical protein D3C85_1239130 [compost metagenome]
MLAASLSSLARGAIRIGVAMPWSAASTAPSSASGLQGWATAIGCGPLAVAWLMMSLKACASRIMMSVLRP